MRSITCARCGSDCSNYYVSRGYAYYCPSCAEYFEMVDQGLGTQWNIPKTCEGCGAKLPYTGMCGYCGRNNRHLLEGH